MARDAPLPVLRVLAVDRDHRARRGLASQLEALGCHVEEAATAAEARELARGEPFALALCDPAAAGGPDLVSELLAEQPSLSVVVVSRDASARAVAEAIRRGARDYLAKPLAAERIRRLVADERRRVDEVRPDLAQDAVDLAVPIAARELVRRAAGCALPVLVRGPRGAWKRAVARRIHARSARGAARLVEVSAREGTDLAVVLSDPAARGGTLLVHEVGALAPGAQDVLLAHLRALASAPPTPEGGVRVLATTSDDLAARARAGAFRRDVLNELTALELELAPLRSRPLEILPLARAIAAALARERGIAPPGFSPAARRLLVTSSWPGNVRELREVLARAISARPGAVLEPGDFPDAMAVGAGDAAIAGASVTLQELEHEHVARVVAWASSFDEAARVLGMDPSTVRRKLRRWRGSAASDDPWLRAAGGTAPAGDV